MRSELRPDGTPPTVNVSHGPSSRVIRQLRRLWTDIAALLNIPHSCVNDARVAYRVERERAIGAQLAVTPVRELRRFSEGQVRYGAIEAAGIRTVGGVLATSRSRLESIRGVGSKSSVRVLTAAHRLENDVRRRLKVRFDVDRRPGEQTDLLNSLRALDEARRSVRPLRPRLNAVTLRIDADFADARVAASRFRRMFALPRRKERATMVIPALFWWWVRPVPAKEPFHYECVW